MEAKILVISAAAFAAVVGAGALVRSTVFGEEEASHSNSGRVSSVALVDAATGEQTGSSDRLAWYAAYGDDDDSYDDDYEDEDDDEREHRRGRDDDRDDDDDDERRRGRGDGDR